MVKEDGLLVMKPIKRLLSPNPKQVAPIQYDGWILET